MKNRSKIAIILSTVLIAAATVSIVFSLEKKNDGTLPKYVFLFIGDGMGMNHVAATESFLAYQDSCYGGAYLTFTKFPVVGIARTWCSTSGVTDSAASGTAIACGQKTSSGRIGEAEDKSPLKSMAYDFKELGYQVGIMSDGPVNHATPATFFANADRRSRYYEISLQMADCGLDFLGGSEIIDRYGKKHDKEDVVKLIEDKGNAQVCFGFDALKASTAATKIFLPEEPEDCIDFDNADKNKNYDLSMAGKGMQAPDLVEACLGTFDDEKPFFIMCEQGYVDWASHSARTMRTIESVKLLDKAVAKAYEFYLEHPDETLIIVTSDHERGGFSFGTEGYRTAWKVFDEKWEALGHDDSQLSDEDNAALNREGRVSWGSHSHTGAPVPVYAVGKHAERFTGIYENSDIKGKIFGE